MSEFLLDEPARRRRADAERSIAAILDAATRVLRRDPHASVEQIAREAGTSRQTVYAHFAAREVLLEALVERATQRVVAALEAADLERGSAAEALVRLIDVAWDALDGEPFLLDFPELARTPEEEIERHGPVLGYLERIIARGRRSGEFDPALPNDWIAAATIALGHAAAQQVHVGTLTTEGARTVLRQALPRLFGRP